MTRARHRARVNAGARADLVALVRYHSTDTNRDGQIGLSELTRVFQLYHAHSGTVRTGAYRIAPETEDGFAPVP